MNAKPNHILQTATWIVIFSVCVYNVVAIGANATHEVGAGSTIQMDCKDFVGDGTKSIDWRVGDTSSRLNIMTQIKSAKFTQFYDTRYKDRLSRPEWGVCQLSNYRLPDSQDFYCRTNPPEQVKTFRFIIINPPSAAPTLQVSAPYVREGEEALLTCNRDEATQGTVLQYRWKKDNGELGPAQSQNQRTLITERGDQGSYRCVVKNNAGQSPLSQPKTLEVDYTPERTTVTSSSTSEVIYSGDSITLTCTAYGGRPRPTLTWNCMGKTGTTYGQPDRTISSFTSTITKDWHGKSCSCSSSHRSMSPQQADPVTFNVYSSPEGASISSVVPWLENRTYNSICQLTYSGRPDPNYTWYKNNQHIGTGPSISLTASKEDNGKKLKCQVKNAHTDRSGNPIEAEVTINVQYNPVVSLDPPTATVTRKENETLTLSCSGDSNPAASDSNYQWTKDSVHLSGGRQLHIQEVKKTNAGVYRCTVTVQGAQDYGSLSGYAETKVQIQYLHMTVSPVQQTTEYEPLHMNCSADGFPTSINFSDWRQLRGTHDRIIPWTRKTGNIIYLELESVEYTDAGLYICQAKNEPFPKVMAQQNVEVRYTAKQPDHPSKGKRVFTVLGQDISLCLSVEANPSTVTFNWYYSQGENLTRLTEDEHISISSLALQSRLNITKVTIAHMGNYTVHGANGIRNGSDFFFSLIPNDRPAAPVIDPDRSFPTPVSVEIWWRGNFDGGYVQTFSVHYAEFGMDYILYQSGLVDQGYNKYNHTRVTPLKPETIYRFKVVAHNKHEGGSSTASNEVMITTLGRPAVDNTTMNVVRHGSTAYLNWQKPHGAYDAQRIYRHDTTDKRKKRNTDTCSPPTCISSDALSVDTTSYNATGLVEGRKYQFELVIFYRGDVVQRQGFVKTVTRESGPSPSLVEAVVGGAVGVCIAVITVIIIIKIVQRRRHTPKDQTNNNQGQPVYQNVNPSLEEATYQDLQVPDEYEVLPNNRTTQEQAYEELSKSMEANKQCDKDTNYQELNRKDSTEHKNVIGTNGVREEPGKMYEKLRFETGCSLSATN